MGKTGVDRPQQAGTSLVAGFSSTLHNRSLLVPTHKLQNAHTNCVDATNASQYKRLYKYVLFQLGVLAAFCWLTTSLGAFGLCMCV